MENEIMYIKLDDIIPNRFQPREVFDEKALSELAESIKQHGIIEPIIVRPVSNKYEIVAGERRYKASALAGLTKIPAIVRKMDDKESSIIAFIENLQRKNVSAIEEARTMDRILKANNMTQEELAKDVGISQSALANKLRLLSLPMEVQESLMKNEISERHARSLLSVKDTDKQLELLKKIKEKRMTVRELDSEIKMMNGNNNEYLNFVNNYMNDNNTGVENQNYTMNNANSANNNVNYDAMSTNNNISTNYLNNFGPTHPINSIPDVSGDNANNGDFMNFLNNYDQSHPVTEPTAENANNSDFTNFLNNYDQNHPISEPTAENASNGDFMNFLNNYDQSHPVNEPATENANNGDFMNFLNNYDQSHPVTEPATENANNGDFMNFLNNYDQSHPVTEPATENADNGDFMNFLNKYDQSHPVEKEENPTITPTTTNYDSYLNNNVVLNDVNPPVTGNFNANSYVEDNPNYVDITKADVMESVDAIINELKGTIDKIKSQSKFKVDTDEIDFDDIYQITIKVDKRETL